MISVCPLTTITFDGKPITYQLVMDQLTVGGAFRARGARVNEDPERSHKKGVVSRGDIRTSAGVRTHVEEQPIGISTTHDLTIAQKFALENSDSRSAENTPAVHLFCHSLVPDEDKSYVPTVLPGLCNTYQKEQETVFHNSVPEEVYMGNTSPNISSFGFSFKPNALFLDPQVVLVDKMLLALYFERIYYPYKYDFGPKLGGRKIGITDFQLATYEKGKKEFYQKYQQTKNCFFSERQQSSVQQQLNPLIAAWKPFL